MENPSFSGIFFLAHDHWKSTFPIRIGRKMDTGNKENSLKTTTLWQPLFNNVWMKSDAFVNGPSQYRMPSINSENIVLIIANLVIHGLFCIIFQVNENSNVEDSAPIFLKLLFLFRKPQYFSSSFSWHPGAGRE